MASLKAEDTVLGSLELVDFEPPEGQVAVAVFDGHVEAGDAGLAILAMGNAYWMVMHDERYVICVAENREGPVLIELSELAKLSQTRSRGGRFNYKEFDFDWISFVLFATVLIGVFAMQSRVDLVTSGQVDAVAMIQGGEWSRGVTALTLHADIVHLASNLISGMGFAFFVCRFFGAAGGWLLILLSGVAGNMLNAWVYYPEVHYSIGASTAVFGALGLLTGIGLWAAVSAPDRRLLLPRWLIPIFGGLTLLGLFGVGDGNIDVAAHISGFICGVALGALAAWGQLLFLTLQRWRAFVAVVSLLLVAGAWGVALSA